MVAKSFARIHAANLINAGIIPFTFDNPDDYDKLSQGDMLTIEGLFSALKTGNAQLTTQSGVSVSLSCSFSERQREILLAGGLLPYTRK